MRAKIGSRLRTLLTELIRADRVSFALLQSFGTQIGVLAINLATGIITARLLGPEGRGIFAAVTTWPQLLASLAVAGLANALLVSLRKSADTRPALSSAGLLMGVVSATVAVAAGIVAVPALLRHYDSWVIVLAQLCLIGTYTNVYQMLSRQILAGFGAYRLFNFSSVLPPLFYLIGLLLIMAGAELTATNAAVALIVSAFFAVLVLTPTVLRIARPTLRGVRSEFHRLSSYSVRAFGNDLVGALTIYIDRLILIPIIAAEELGLYVVAFSFSRLILIVQPAISSVLLSHLSEANPEQAKSAHDHALRFSLYGFALAGFVLFLIDRRLLSIIYGAEFGAAAILFRILLVEAALSCMAQVTVQLYFSMNHPGYVSIVQTISMAISLAVMAALVPLLGVNGAALGILIAAVGRLALLWSGIPRKLKLGFPRLYLTRADVSYLLQRFR